MVIVGGKIKFKEGDLVKYIGENPNFKNGIFYICWVTFDKRSKLGNGCMTRAKACKKKYITKINNYFLFEDLESITDREEFLYRMYGSEVLMREGDRA